MNRNVESHFAELPSIDIERSRFDRSSSHKTSFNIGQLIPFWVEEVLPGDTFDVTTSIVARLQTLITPVMDNIYLDTYYFFVPNRIVWEHWKQFMGENTDSPWIPQSQYKVPVIAYPENGFASGTIADYMGIPVGVEASEKYYPIALPFRAFAEIYDQWFRDQNVMDPLVIPHSDSTVTGVNTGNYITDVAKGGLPPLVCKYHDYFTSCLPSPQKGYSVSIFGDNVANPTDRLVPVQTGADRYSPAPSGSRLGAFPDRDIKPLAGYALTDASEKAFVKSNRGTSSSVTINTLISTEPTNPFEPTNLWANVGAMSLSINELRLAFQLQKFFERSARTGSRYRETLKAHFNVTSPDSRMMIPEYLGGHRFPLSIHQVANQSQGENDFLGDLGAMSNTSDVHSDFIKSFSEHGFVIGVMCARYDHSYPQGLERFWNRQNITDYYWPVFANIGEQPVYKSEIMLSGSYVGTNEVFGYQEAWADYRYKPSRVSGEMRPNIQNTLASWHLADNYANIPSLSASWMMEDKTNVDRVLAVTSAVSNQVFCDIYVQNIATRAMPMYSIPGLIDHH